MKQIARRESSPPSLIESLIRRVRDLAWRGESNPHGLRDTLEELISEAEEGANTFSEEGVELIRNALSFGELRVDDVMIPRADIVWLDADKPQNRVPVVRDILPGQHLQDTGHVESRRSIDTRDSRVVARRAVHLQMRHARIADILEVSRLSQDMAPRVRALGRRPDDLKLGLPLLREIGRIDGRDAHCPVLPLPSSRQRQTRSGRPSPPPESPR